MKRNQGFTLVEILIVVIILGILAAIVIPQFTEASNDARTSALSSDLQTVRSQLELYKVQHLEAYPGMTTGSFVATEFVNQLTSRTNQAGAVGTDPNSYPLGPYLRRC
jgi:general secretion pathway protein G